MRRLLRFPWPTPLIVLLAAIVAAAGGYALAASRPGAPAKEPFVAQSWIAETPVPDPANERSAPPKALAAAPPGVKVARTLLMATPNDYGAGGIQAVPAGRYAVYASCKVVNPPKQFKNVTVSLFISHSGRSDYTSVPCPVNAGAPVLRLNAAEDVVVHAGFELTVPDPDQAPDTLWTSDVGVALFFVAE